MAKYKKIIVAGPLVIETVYPAPNPRDNAGVRAGKKHLSSEAQQRMNLKYAWQKLELEIAANFGINDLFVCFTYEDKFLPKSRKQANSRMQAFWKKLRAARKVLAHELRYLYVTEHKHGDGRWHHHALINSTGEDYDTIRSLWGQGNVEFKQIRVDREKNYLTLAKYLCKEQRDKVGQRLWSGSRNLKKPEKECFRVPNDTPLTPPRTAAVLDDTGDVRTEYGHYRYIKYIAGGWPKKGVVKAKRRRKHRPTLT